MSDIQLLNISKFFGSQCVFSDINLEMSLGELILLKGASGSGKTTLLNIIGGLEQPSSGEVAIGGKKISQLKNRERVKFYRQQIGFVFQDFYLHPQLTVLKNISLAGIFADFDKEAIRQRIQTIAKALGLESILNHKINQISGGQAERVCIARALFMSPKIILADEPTNNLDENNAENVIKILRAVAKSMNLIVLISSHNPMVDKYADRILKLEHGKMHEITKVN